MANQSKVGLLTQKEINNLLGSTFGQIIHDTAKKLKEVDPKDSKKLAEIERLTMRKLSSSKSAKSKLDRHFAVLKRRKEALKKQLERLESLTSNKDG